MKIISVLSITILLFLLTFIVFVNSHTVLTENMVIGKVVDKHQDTSETYIYIGDIFVPITSEEYWVEVMTDGKVESYNNYIWYNSCQIGQDFKFVETYNDFLNRTKLKTLGCN